MTSFCILYGLCAVQSKIVRYCFIPLDFTEALMMIMMTFMMMM